MLASGGGTARELEQLAGELAQVSPPLLLALAAALAVWLLSLLLHCFLQAGTYGVLAAADRQALPGLAGTPALFRTFSLRDFLGWGSALRLAVLRADRALLGAGLPRRGERLWPG